MRTNVNDRFSIVLIKHNLQSLFSLLSFDLPVISFDKVTLNLPKLLISVPPGIRNRRERHVGTFETLEFRFHVKKVIIFGAAGLYSLNLTFCCVIFALK